jgi:hypothetical protein
MQEDRKGVGLTEGGVWGEGVEGKVKEEGEKKMKRR